MARNKRRLRNPKHSSLEEAVQLALSQPRRDREGNKIQGHTIEEIQAMMPEQRRYLYDTIWLHQQWLKTQDRRG
jgi:hypothetical protein